MNLFYQHRWISSLGEQLDCFGEKAVDAADLTAKSI
jgi:hypothetical protein